LEKTSKIIKSNHQPITTTPAKPCPEVPYLPVFEHLQGWGLHYFPGQPVKKGKQEERDKPSGDCPSYSALPLQTLHERDPFQKDRKRDSDRKWEQGGRKQHSVSRSSAP